jgi:MFS family permease
LLVLVVLGGSTATAAVAVVVFLPRGQGGPLGFLLVLRFLFGVFQAGTFPVLSRLLADWIPASGRGSAQGLLWMCSRAGGVLAPVVMVWLYHRFGDWRTPLVLGGGLGVAWCAAVWPWLRNRPEESPHVNASERSLIAAGRAGRAAGRHGRAPWRAMIRSANVWALCWMYGFFGFGGNFFLYMFANYLQDYRHFDKDTAKWLTATPFACGVVACVAGGVLSDLVARRTGNRRLGRSLVGASGLGLAGTLMLISPWVDDPRWLGVLYGLTFFGNDLTMGPAWAAAGEIGERHAGTLAGAMNMMGSFLGALAAVIAARFFHAAALAERAGDLDARALYMAAPFVAFAAGYFVSALCWLRVDVTETLPQGDD